MSQNSDFFDQTLDYGKLHTKKPYYRKYSQSNKNQAALDINRDAPPVELDIYIGGFLLRPDDSTGDLKFDDSVPFTSLPPLDYDKERTKVDLAVSAISLAKIEEYEEHMTNLNESYQVKVYEPEKFSCPHEQEEHQHEVSFSCNQKDIITSAIKLIHTEAYIMGKNKFVLESDKFSLDPVYSPELMRNFNNKMRKMLRNVLSFQDRHLTPPADFKVKIAYIPSGGGKSTMVRYSLHKDRYVDVDDFIRLHWERWNAILDFKGRTMMPGNVVNKWFQYHLHKATGFLNGKILLMNHPNQMPMYFRRHEVIIIPCEARFGLRSFTENYFSLLSCSGIRKVVTDYDNYELVIEKMLNISD